MATSAQTVKASIEALLSVTIADMKSMRGMTDEKIAQALSVFAEGDGLRLQARKLRALSMLFDRLESVSVRMLKRRKDAEGILQAIRGDD